MRLADLQQRVTAVVLKNPDLATAGAAIGGGASSGNNTGRLFISLKPWNERKANAQQIIDRLRPQLAPVPGITTYLQPVQSIQIGGRLGRTQYQYTLQDIDMSELQEWAPKLEAKLKTIPGLQDVARDLESINHQGQFPAVTLSFNLAAGTSLGDAVRPSNGRPKRSDCRRLSRPRSRARLKHSRTLYRPSLCWLAGPDSVHNPSHIPLYGAAQ